MAGALAVAPAAAAPDGLPLGQLLPDEAEADRLLAEPVPTLRAAWASTFIASLELANRGEAAMAQGDRFTVIHVSLAGMEASA